ncbi:MAG: TerB family tellurite resistance protein [Streptomyces sp.]
MRRSRERRGQRRVVRVAGLRTSWHTVDDGDFFCPGCGGDRSYRRRTGRQCFVVLGVPLLPRGEVDPVVQCAACHGHFGTDALDHLTTNRLATLLRDGVQAIALTVLAAGGCESRTAREAAVDTVRGAGFPDCGEDQLLTLLAALGVDSVSAEIELHEALAPLAPHLAPAGRESLLLQGARIALSDGVYQLAEREALAAVGRSLWIAEADIDRLLAEARTPH